MIKIIMALALALSLNALTITQYQEFRVINPASVNIYIAGMASGIYVVNSLMNQSGICIPDSYTGFPSIVMTIIDDEIIHLQEVNKQFAQTDSIELVYLLGLLRKYPCLLNEPEKE